MTTPCEPPLFSHMFVKEQLTPACHQQTNGFTLSRPRDFISALTKERDASVGCRFGDNSQTSATPGESYNSLDTSADISLASTASRHHLRTQPEDQSSSFVPLTSTVNLDCSVTEFRDNCSTSSTRRGEALNQNQEIYSDTEEKREG